MMESSSMAVIADIFVAFRYPPLEILIRSVGAAVPSALVEKVRAEVLTESLPVSLNDAIDATG
jgi:hypothetical protein